MVTTTKPTWRKNRVPVILDPIVRFTIYQEMASGEVGSPEVRDLVLEALRARGWTEERMKQEYLEYSLKCQRSGEENQFSGGKA